MGVLIDSLPPNILTNLKQLSMSYNDMVQYTIAIRSKFNTFKTIPNARMFWKLCAINELHELTAEFPWIVWKPSFKIDYHKAKLEAIDVITLTIGALSCNNDNICIYKKYDIYPDVDAITIHKDYFDLVRFTEDINTIINCINELVRPIEYYTEADQVKIYKLINKLCSISKMDYIDLNAYWVAKLALAFCRIDLESRTYHSDWHKTSKDGWTECQMLEFIIKKYLSNASNTLYDLACMVEEEGVRFIY